MVMQQMQPPLQPGDPRLQQVIGIENDISDLDVDITIEEGIDIPSLQAEEFQSLVQLASVQPGLIPGDVLIAASGLRDKDHDPRAHEATPAAAAAGPAGRRGNCASNTQGDIQGKQAKAQARHGAGAGTQGQRGGQRAFRARRVQRTTLRAAAWAPTTHRASQPSSSRKTLSR